MDRVTSLDTLKTLSEEYYISLNDRLDKNVNIDNTGEYPKLKPPFFKNQTRRALRNFGIINPYDINDYIAVGGYQGLYKAIFNMEPQEVVDEVKKAGLRGLGGAGFPTGIKWQGALDQSDEKKYVVMNADEGDPGAFMDRSIMEGDPHSVLEGMAICGRAIGADEGFIYIRAEYPKAVETLRKAIKAAEELGFLGKNIFGSDFSFTIQIRLGSGAFVCGEGSALLESIEGRRGMPQAKVYRTNVKGLWDKPTVINNVETLSNVPAILRNGYEYFNAIGTEDSPGTKVFALVGKVRNSGLVEIPMGTTIDELVNSIGGGVEDGREIKAVQTGGPSGGCIPPKYFDKPIDFKNLAEIGSIMGSGGVVVMDNTDCMVDIARFFLEFTVDESCGKCTPCRDGTKRVLEIIEGITKGKGTLEDLEELKFLSQLISDTSLCGLGKTACNPVISTIEHFIDEYEAHIIDKRCPAGVCKELLTYTITDKCIGCGLCKRECPVNCISGEPRQIHHIDITECIKCDNCRSVCPVDAVLRA